MYLPYRPKRASQRIAVKRAEPQDFEEPDITDIGYYSGKRIKFLKDLPKTVVDDWEVGRTVMHYVTHTNNMVIYTITQEVGSEFDNSREIIDSKTVALFYANAGNGAARPYPVARRTSESTRLHRSCGTNPALRHLVIEHWKNKNYSDSGCWCNQFLWGMGYPVSERF